MTAISCVQCSFTFELTPDLRACPRCGAQKAAKCRSCDTAIYVGASTCQTHSAAAARVTAPSTPQAVGSAVQGDSSLLTMPRRHMLPADPCDVCGRGNTAEVTFRSVTGMVVLYQSRRQTGRFCRDCGTRLYDKHQRHCLTLGWWGVVSLWVNIFAVVTNVVNGGEIKQLGAPVGVTAVRP